MSHLKTKIITHSQAVCSLYKACVRNIEANYSNREDIRYECVLLRAKFDAKKNITDPREAKRLYMEALEKLEADETEPIRFPSAPYGSAYDRWGHVPDIVMDFWHPIEKAAYPKYFATREQRKIEYVEYCKKQEEEKFDGGSSAPAH